MSEIALIQALMDDPLGLSALASLLMGALDYMPRALILACSDGQIVHSNAAAASYLDQMPMLDNELGRLRFPDPGGAELQAAFEAAADADAARSSCILLRAPGQPNFVISFLPLAADRKTCSHVLVQVQELPLAKAEPGRLRTLLGLTPAETEVAIGVGQGATLREIAAKRGVSETTVKVQLKTLMRKVGCRRQAEVAALVRSLMPIHGYS